MKMLPDTVSGQAIAYNTAASGGASVVSLAAASGNRHIIDWITWSYAADPTGGSLTISDVTNTFLIDIIVGGPGQVTFGERGLALVSGAAATITLADGSQTKRLNVGYR